MKRIADMDSNEDLERVQVMLPQRLLEKLKEFAYEREISRGAVIRQALKDYFAKIENPSPSNPEQEFSEESLTEILEQCETYFGGFETTGEEGFFNMAQQHGLKLKTLTDTQFLKVAEKLKIGYQGFLFAPSIDEFLEYATSLEPTSEQEKLLRLILEHDLSWTVDKSTTVKSLSEEIDEKLAKEE